MTKQKVEFAVKKGAPFPESAKEIVGNELLRIQKKNGGILNPHDVVKEAGSKKSPLHSYIFNCSMDQAAENWFLHRARLMINHIEIIYVEKAVKVNRPLFINIRNTAGNEEEESSRGYIDYVTVASKEEYRRQALQDALNQLIHWKTKYGWLKELSGVVEKIIVLESELNL